MEGTLKVDRVQEGWQTHKHAIFSHAESIRTVPETQGHRSLRQAQRKKKHVVTESLCAAASRQGLGFK